jgi:hypothetical protein
LKLLLRKEGHIFHRTSEFEIVREIKEKVCTVASSSHPIPNVGATKEEKKDVSLDPLVALIFDSCLGCEIFYDA